MSSQTPNAGWTDDPKEILTKLQSSDDKIQDIQCHCIISTPDRPNHEVFMDHDWWCKGAKHGFSGHVYATSPIDGQIMASKNTVVFDGNVLKTLQVKKSRTSGEQTRYNPDTFTVFFSVVRLLGINIRPDGLHPLSETLLRSQSLRARKVREPVDGHECVVLEADGVYSTSSGTAFDVVAWIDPSRNYRVLKLERYRRQIFRPRHLDNRLHHIELMQVEGTWFPLAGELQHLALSPILSRDDNFDELRKLGPEEGSKRISGKIEPFSTFRLKLDVATLKLNQGIEDRQFGLEFPQGTGVWDGFTSRSYIVGENAAGQMAAN